MLKVNKTQNKTLVELSTIDDTESEKENEDDSVEEVPKEPTLVIPAKLQELIDRGECSKMEEEDSAEIDQLY